MPEIVYSISFSFSFSYILSEARGVILQRAMTFAVVSRADGITEGAGV